MKRIEAVGLRNLTSKILVALLLTMAAVSIVVSVKKALAVDGSKDFQYAPSRALLNHEDPYSGYLSSDPSAKQFMLSQVPNYPASGYPYLWPYAAMDWRNARLFWCLSNIAFSALILIGLQLLFPLKDKIVLMSGLSLFFISTPYRNLVSNGQHAFMCLAMFCWSIIASRKSKFLSGLLLSAAWFKYTITFPLTLYFLTRKDFKPVCYAALIHASITVFVSFWIREPISSFFLSSVKVGLLTTELGDLNITAVISRLNLPHGVGVFFVLMALIPTALVMIKHHEQRRDLLLLSYFSLFSYALFFHLRYDLVVLIFPFWLLLVTLQEESVSAIPRFTRMTLAVLLAVTWYGQRIVDVFPIQSAAFAFLNLLTCGTSAILLYGALIATATSLFKEKDVSISL